MMSCPPYYTWMSCCSSKARLLWKVLRERESVHSFLFSFFPPLHLCNSPSEITITGPVRLQEMLVDIHWAERVRLRVFVWNSQQFSLTSARITIVNLKTRCRAPLSQSVMGWHRRLMFTIIVPVDGRFLMSVENEKSEDGREAGPSFAGGCPLAFALPAEMANGYGYKQVRSGRQTGSSSFTEGHVQWSEEQVCTALLRESSTLAESVTRSNKYLHTITWNIKYV